MRIRYSMVILFALAICINAIASNERAAAQSQTISISIDTLNNGSFPSSEETSALTALINTINNLYTRDNIIIACVSLVMLLFGFIGLRSIKERIDDFKKEIDSEKELRDAAEKLNKKYEEIEKVQTLNNQYLQKINQWMLANAYSIADTPGGNTTQGRDLMGKSILNYYLMKLFLSRDKHEIDGCINYIKTKGGKDEIEHLQFIVDNDTDKYKRDRASEAIGYIQGRVSSIS